MTKINFTFDTRVVCKQCGMGLETNTEEINGEFYLSAAPCSFCLEQEAVRIASKVKTLLDECIRKR